MLGSSENRKGTMANQICPYCHKEFTPRDNIQTHTYCSRKCSTQAYRERFRMNEKIRKEMGLPVTKFKSKYASLYKTNNKKVDE